MTQARASGVGVSASLTPEVATYVLKRAGLDKMRKSGIALDLTEVEFCRLAQIGTQPDGSVEVVADLGDGIGLSAYLPLAVVTDAFKIHARSELIRGGVDLGWDEVEFCRRSKLSLRDDGGVDVLVGS